MLQELANAVTLAAIYLLFALGMSLTWGTIGVLNFAHGSIFMFSAFIDFLVVREIRLPMLTMMIIGAAAGAALSVLVHLLVFDPILRRGKSRHQVELQLLIGGIGAATIPVAIAEKITASNPSFGYNAGSFQTHVYHLAGLLISNTQIVVVVVAVILTSGLAIWLRRSRTGLALRAIGVDAETASIMGINGRGMATVTMAIAGTLAGLAGVLLTYNLGALMPDSGDSLLVKAFAVIILGGVGSITGAMIGTFILACVETVILTQTSGTWVDAVSFGLIIIVLLVRPQGILGRREVRKA